MLTDKQITLPASVLLDCLGSLGKGPYEITVAHHAAHLLRNLMPAVAVDTTSHESDTPERRRLRRRRRHERRRPVSLDGSARREGGSRLGGREQRRHRAVSE